MSVTSQAVQVGFVGIAPARCECRRCGRVLTDPASVAAGVGPVCAALEKYGGGDASDPESATVYLDRPISGGVVFGYDGDPMLAGTKFVSNVPMRISGKSRDFACGYSGSGPSAFALNMIEAVLLERGYEGARFVPYPEETCFDLSWSCYQDAKRAFVAAAPQGVDLTVLPYDLLCNWIDAFVSANAEKIEDLTACLDAGDRPSEF